MPYRLAIALSNDKEYYTRCHSGMQELFQKKLAFKKHDDVVDRLVHDLRIRVAVIRFFRDDHLDDVVLGKLFHFRDGDHLIL